MRSVASTMIVALLAMVTFPVFADDGRALIEAAQRRDFATVKKLVEKGTDVDTKSRYGATALFFASDKGSLEMVEYLLEKGASVNVTDSFYQASPLTWALFKMDESPVHRDIVLRLLEAGSDQAGAVLGTAIRQGDVDLAKAALATDRIDDDALRASHAQAVSSEQPAIAALLEPRLPAEPEVAESAEEESGAPVALTAEARQRYVGHYRNQQIGMEVKIFVEGEALKARPSGQPVLTLDVIAEHTFTTREQAGIETEFSGRGGLMEQFELRQGGQTAIFARYQPESEAVAAAALPDLPAAPRGKALPWPSFRGAAASGIGDGQGVPADWDGAKGVNLRWKTRVPGIALSSPVIWGDRVFVTTAVSEGDDRTFRTGIYGDVDSVDDDSVHGFVVFALDRATGEVVWRREASRGVPKVKRHLKSSHANPTPATDGERLIVHFGSEGIFCYDLEGTLLWEKDLGVLGSGWFYDASYEWGFASSPILWEGKVILQSDIYQGSFIAALDLTTGEELWRTARDEVPSWGTPNVLPAAEPGGVDEVVANGTTIRGYNADTGAERWTLSPNSEVTVGTPVVADGLAYVTGGYPPVRPIYAIRPGGRGDLSLGDGATSSDQIAWSVSPGGTYIPTPIVYRGILYMLNNNGRLAAYDAKTGELVYRKRVGSGTSFSGSPVAADGRLFITSEEGVTFVVRAGRDFEEMGTNELGEVVMTTPAISDGLMIIRGMEHVFGIGLAEQAAAAGETGR